MRKYLLVLITLILVLVGCGGETEADSGETTVKAHVNISDDMVGDSYQVMRIIEKAVNDDEEINYKVLDDYYNKYFELWNHEDESMRLTDEEVNLFTTTAAMIELIDSYITIGSERLDFEKAKDKFFDVMENGE